MSDISRTNVAESLTITSGQAVSNAFEFGGASGLNVHMPAAWTAASIGFKVCDTESGTFIPLYDDDGTLVQIDSPAVDKAYNAPAALFASIWVKLWSQDGSGNDTNQAAGRTVVITMKG